jgi:hypothetical protein
VQDKRAFGSNKTLCLAWHTHVLDGDARARVVIGRCASICDALLGVTLASLRDRICVATFSPLSYFTTVVWLRHIAESCYFRSQRRLYENCCTGSSLRVRVDLD